MRIFWRQKFKMQVHFTLPHATAAYMKGIGYCLTMFDEFACKAI